MIAFNSDQAVQTDEEEMMNQCNDDFYFNDGNTSGEDDKDINDSEDENFQFNRKTVRITNRSSDKLSHSKKKEIPSSESKHAFDPCPDSINTFLMKQYEVTISELQSEILSLNAELSSTKENLQNLEELCSSKKSLPCGCICVCPRKTPEFFSPIKDTKKKCAAHSKVEASDASCSKVSSVTDELAARDERIAQLEGSLIEMSMKLAMSKSVQDEYRLKSRRRSSNISTISHVTPTNNQSSTQAAINPCKRHSDFIPRASSKKNPDLANDGNIISSASKEEMKESCQIKCIDGNASVTEEGNFAIRKLIRGFRSRQHGQVQATPGQTGQRQRQQSQTHPNGDDKHERSFSLNILDKIFSNEIQPNSSPSNHHDNRDGVANSSRLTPANLINNQASSKPTETLKFGRNEEKSLELSSSLKDGALGYFKGFQSSWADGNSLTDNVRYDEDNKGGDDCSNDARSIDPMLVDEIFEEPQVEINITNSTGVVAIREEGDNVIWGSDSPKLEKIASKTVKNGTELRDSLPPFSQVIGQVTMRRQVSEPNHPSLKSHHPKSRHRSSISNTTKMSHENFGSAWSTGENAKAHSAFDNGGDASRDVDRGIQNAEVKSLKNATKQLSSSAVYSRNVGQYLNEMILKERKNASKHNGNLDGKGGEMCDHDASPATGSSTDRADTNVGTNSDFSANAPNNSDEDYQDFILPTKQPQDNTRTRTKQHTSPPSSLHTKSAQSNESNQPITNKIKFDPVKIRRMTSDPYHTTATRSQEPNHHHSLRRSSANGITQIQSSGRHDSRVNHKSKSTDSFGTIRERRQILTDGDDYNSNKPHGRNVSFQPEQIKPSRRIPDKRLSSSVTHSRNVGMFLNEMISSRKITKNNKASVKEEKPMGRQAPSQPKTLADSYCSTGAETMTTVATADDELDLSISFRDDQDNKSDVQFLLPTNTSRSDKKSAHKRRDSPSKRRDRPNSISSSITDSVVFPETMADVLKASMIDIEED
ncbi:hypothetical protein ACHAXS_006983 [Conticribra weissflogii]